MNEQRIRLAILGIVALMLMLIFPARAQLPVFLIAYWFIAINPVVINSVTNFFKEKQQ